MRETENPHTEDTVNPMRETENPHTEDTVNHMRETENPHTEDTVIPVLQVRKLRLGEFEFLA